MKEKLEPLLKLQEVEINIARLTAFLRTVAEKIDALDAKHTSHQVAYDSETAARDALKKKYRAMESDIQTNIAQIKKSQDKLNSVKNNKEYQAILKEVDDTKDRNFCIEDEMIACLEQMEALEADLAEKKKVLDQLQIQVISEKEDIRREAEDDTKRLSEAEKQQAYLMEYVDPSLLSDYNRVKRLVKVPVLVPVKQCICQGCYLNIPPQMFIELQRSDKLKLCPHCSRIIYWSELLND